MNSMQIRWSVLLLLLTGILTGCYYDKEQILYPGSNVDCSTVSGTFGNVRTIVSGKCATAGCHNASSAAGGTILETYDQVKAKADRIMQRTILDKTMPPGMPLSANEIAILKCWIDSGLPNN